MQRKERKFRYGLAVLVFGMAVFSGTNVFGAAGNVDGMGEVDLKDAVLALQVCAGSSAAGVTLDADVNGDNKIGLAEVVYVLRFLSNSSGSTGDLGIPDDYEETLVNFRESFPDTAGSFDNFVGQLPESFDWRNFGVVTRAKRGGNPITPIENQGSCGSCWAFGSVAALESKILMAGGPVYDLSEQQQISCNTNGHHGCCGGNISAVKFWTDRGPVQESCTGYGDYSTRTSSCGCREFPPFVYCSNVSCSSFSSCTGLSYRIKDYHTVDASNTEEVKISVYGYGPGVFRYDFYEDFNTFWWNGSYGEVYVQSSPVQKGGHVVSIIGWDDSKGAWLCKNSWGVEGPNGDGTFWMAYSGHRNNLGFAMSNFSITGGLTCEYDIYPTGQSFSSSGGTGSISLNTSNGCAWTASSNKSWLTITSQKSGTGSSTVFYSVPANTGTVSQTGIISIEGKTFTITQAGLSCSYSINPYSKSFESSGGTDSISVTAASGCNWTARSNDSWITVVSGSNGNGNGTVSYFVAQKTDKDSRTGTLTVAGKTFTVTQKGISCTYSISPSNRSVGYSGGNGNVNVTVSDGCIWTAESNDSWILVTSGSNGTGNGTVSYLVTQNTDISPRNGTMTIAGKTFMITQSYTSMSINFNVLGEDQVPVSHAQIQVYSTNDRNTLLAQGVTAQNGQVLISVPFVAGASYIAKVEAGGYPAFTVKSDFINGNSLGNASVDAYIFLNSQNVSGRIRGIVNGVCLIDSIFTGTADEYGNIPVPNAHYEFPWGITYSGTTDADGRYNFPLPSGFYKLRISYPGSTYENPERFVYAWSDNGFYGNEDTGSLDYYFQSTCPVGSSGQLEFEESIACSCCASGEAFTSEDTDNDGMINSWEIRYGFDICNPNDADIDSDGDGLSNLEELIRGTKPLVNNAPFPSVADNPVPYYVVKNFTTVFPFKVINPANDKLKLKPITQPQNGKVSYVNFNATYTPDTGFSGNDSFSFRLWAVSGRTISDEIVLNVKVVPVWQMDGTPHIMWFK